MMRHRISRALGTVVVFAAGLAIGCAVAQKPAASPASPNPERCVQAVADHQRTVQARFDAARSKMNARDGKGCVLELDAYDRLDPWSGLSTNVRSPLAMTRGMCLMLGGQCSAGRELYRAALVTSAGANFDPGMLDRSTDAIASMYCQGGTMTPRDELLKALMDVQQGAYLSKKDRAGCLAAYETAKRLIPSVAPRDEDDTQITQASARLRVGAPECLARAGDCDTAWKIFREVWSAEVKQLDEAALRKMFGNVVQRCAGK